MTLAWLRARGLLASVEHGSTPRTRPAALAGLGGNRAAVYLLTRPLPRLVQDDQDDQDGETAAATGGEPVPPAAGEATGPVPAEPTATPPESRRDSGQTPRAREGAMIDPTPAAGDKAAATAPARLVVLAGVGAVAFAASVG